MFISGIAERTNVFLNFHKKSLEKGLTKAKPFGIMIIQGKERFSATK